MPSDARELRQRADRLRPAAVSASGASARSTSYPPGQPRVVGVIRSIDEVNKVIRWQRVRYKGKPPVVGQYKAYGPIEDGYPMEFSALDEYKGLESSDPLTETAQPIIATFRHGAWILEALGGRGSVFPVVLSSVSGSAGNATSAASYRYTVRDALTNQALSANVQLTTSNGTPLTPHRWRRPAAGRMTVATFGYASRDSQGRLVIGWINEMVEQQVCS